MVSLNNKNASRPLQTFILERIEGSGYTVIDSKNSLTLEQKQFALSALSETGVARPEDSPFQCFLSYNEELDKIIINYLEDGVNGNVKCRQFWFVPLAKSNLRYFLLKVIMLVFLSVFIFLLGFYMVEISSFFRDKNTDHVFVPVLISCNDQNHIDLVEKYKKVKTKISDNENVIKRMITFLSQKSLGLPSKGEPQPCISLREEVGSFSGTTSEKFNTNETGGLLELLKNIKDF